MSERDDLPDPIDRAYAEAEAMLEDSAARAARRARVLAAVAGEATKATATSAEAPAPTGGPRGGWLAAASIAGVGLLIATQVYRSEPLHTPHAKAGPEAHSERAPATASAPPPPAAINAEPSSAEPAQPAHRSAAAPQRQAAPVARDAEPAPMAAAPEAPASAKAAPAPAPAPAPAVGRAELRAPRNEGVEELVVTGSRIEDSSGSSDQAHGPAAKLRAAAAAGRVRAVNDLLASGTAVDAADERGVTALMAAVRAGRVDVVRLLLRHGANPDRSNRAGQSARDMAASQDDLRIRRAMDPEQ